MSCHMAVLTSPGWTALAVTPVPSISAARQRVNRLSAILLLWYALNARAGGCSEAADEMLITLPQPRASIPGRNARQTRYGAITLVDSVIVQSFGSVSATGTTGPILPTALTTISIFPAQSRST